MLTEIEADFISAERAWFGSSMRISNALEAKKWPRLYGFAGMMSSVERRSATGQVEYWARIGMIAAKKHLPGDAYLRDGPFAMRILIVT